uniref:Uncharacterized protein n=2 Tax=Pavo cristatus TaxID=9049 RepID=A0A8C9LDQ6_PAVCR
RCASPSCFMYTYVNTTAVALERNLTRLQELRDRLQNGTETEPLPPELRPIVGEPPPPGAELDPLVAAFLRRQRRMEEAGQRRNASTAQRLQRFLSRKYRLFRGSCPYRSGRRLRSAGKWASSGPGPCRHRAQWGRPAQPPPSEPPTRGPPQHSARAAAPSGEEELQARRAGRT